MIKRLLLATIFIFLLGCCSWTIDREDFDNNENYMAALCGCQHDDNPTVCSEAWKDSAAANKEGRIINRLDHCGKTKYNNMTENECRLYLNQK